MQCADFDLRIIQSSTVSGTKHGFIADGSSNANCSYNRIRLRGQFKNGHMFFGKSCDNNDIDVVGFLVSGGTGSLIYLCAGTSSVPVGANTNRFLKVGGSSAPIFAEGTGVTSASGYGTTNSVCRNFAFLDDGNGIATPTAGTGSYWSVTWALDQAQDIAALLDATIIHDKANVYAAKALRNAAYAAMIHNTAGGLIQLANGTKQYLLRFNGTALELYNPAEVGELKLNTLVTFPSGARANFIDTATSATAGSASALPATPSGYFKVNVGGIEKRVPYYD